MPQAPSQDSWVILVRKIRDLRFRVLVRMRIRIRIRVKVRRKTMTVTIRETNKRHEEKYGLAKGQNHNNLVRKLVQDT